MEIVIETKKEPQEEQPVVQSPVPPIKQMSSLCLPGSCMKLPVPVQSPLYSYQEGVPPTLSPMQSMTDQGAPYNLPVYSQVNAWYGAPKPASFLGNSVKTEPMDGVAFLLVFDV